MVSLLIDRRSVWERRLTMRIVKEADVRKNEILDAAGILFSEKGYDNTSVTDIMNAVGIAKGTLYHHFKSKEDIMDALIKRQTDAHFFRR